ncbi:hypothetical protein DRJ04_05945 [Candidatus Aerophobetes bacterium]|uniref:Uncharacterized protein n=1 Tax=Aerophobetes bacterium TaxID=2030807 RepID=A0A662DEE1_UNCAE|nr:MAG: hypothetical protein DRJ04_05945 [Candidatus Aerophobetes bacterium]
MNTAPKDKSIPFIVITSFFFSFLFARLWVILTKADKYMHQENTTYFGEIVIIKGLHIHHFFYGVVLLCIGGWIALNYREKEIRKIAGLLYGIGLGFFVDEIGFLLTWGEYWSSLTYAVVLLTGVAFLNAVYFTDFWNEVRKNIVLSTREHPLVSKALRIPLLVEVVDKMSNKISKTEKVSLAFAGLVYLVAGIAILIYPRFLYYWVAAGFILGSVSHFIRAIKA